MDVSSLLNSRTINTLRKWFSFHNKEQICDDLKALDLYCHMLLCLLKIFNTDQVYQHWSYIKG